MKVPIGYCKEVVMEWWSIVQFTRINVTMSPAGKLSRNYGIEPVMAEL